MILLKKAQNQIQVWDSVVRAGRVGSILQHPAVMETAHKSCAPVCYKTDTKGGHTTITGYETNHVVRQGAFINMILKIPYDVI